MSLFVEIDGRKIEIVKVAADTTPIAVQALTANAIKLSMQPERRQKTRDSLKQGDRVLAQPDELPSKLKNRYYVRVYYKSEGDELLCIDCGPMGWTASEDFQLEYSPYIGGDPGARAADGILAIDKTAQRATDSLAAQVLHETRLSDAPLDGARLIRLPSQTMLPPVPAPVAPEPPGRPEGSLEHPPAARMVHAARLTEPVKAEPTADDRAESERRIRKGLFAAGYQIEADLGASEWGWYYRVHESATNTLRNVYFPVDRALPVVFDAYVNDLGYLCAPDGVKIEPGDWLDGSTSK